MYYELIKIDLIAFHGIRIIKFNLFPNFLIVHYCQYMLLSESCLAVMVAETTRMVKKKNILYTRMINIKNVECFNQSVLSRIPRIPASRSLWRRHFDELSNQ